MNPITHARRVGTAVVLGAAGLVVAAAPALAHVTVSSPDAAPGGYGKLVFRVPTESDTASTTGLTIQLPTDRPFTSVSTKPIPGWTARLNTTKLDSPVKIEGATVTKAVTSVDWTAAPHAGVTPGEFQEFEVSVGTFPDETDEPLTFPVVQTYSDGKKVNWDQKSTGGEEPEYPAPTLDLTNPSGAEGADEPSVSAATAPTAAESDSGDSSDALARTLAGIGVALGAAALVWSAAGRRTRSG